MNFDLSIEVMITCSMFIFIFTTISYMNYIQGVSPCLGRHLMTHSWSNTNFQKSDFRNLFIYERVDFHSHCINAEKREAYIYPVIPYTYVLTRFETT